MFIVGTLDLHTPGAQRSSVSAFRVNNLKSSAEMGEGSVLAEHSIRGILPPSPAYTPTSERNWCL